MIEKECLPHPLLQVDGKKNSAIDPYLNYRCSDGAMPSVKKSPRNEISSKPAGKLTASGPVTLTFKRPCGAASVIQTACAIRSAHELELYRAGGVLSARRQRLTEAVMNEAKAGRALSAGFQAIIVRRH